MGSAWTSIPVEIASALMVALRSLVAVLPPESCLLFFQCLKDLSQGLSCVLLAWPVHCPVYRSKEIDGDRPAYHPAFLDSLSKWYSCVHSLMRQQTSLLAHPPQTLHSLICSTAIHFASSETSHTSCKSDKSSSIVSDMASASECSTVACTECEHCLSDSLARKSSDIVVDLKYLALYICVKPFGEVRPVLHLFLVTKSYACTASLEIFFKSEVSERSHSKRSWTL